MAGVTRPDRGWRYRTGVGVRAFVALIGSYALAALAATVLARLLPTDRISASVWATLIAMVLPVPIALAVFLARSATHAAIMSAAGIGALTLVAWLIGGAA